MESLQPLNEPQILLVEDNRIQAIVVSQLLRNAGCKVHWLKNGVEAINYLKEKQVDLILMDYEMPEMNGLETTYKIRNESLSSAKIISLTASRFEESCRIGPMGVNACIEKDKVKTELIPLLQQYLPQLSNQRTQVNQNLTSNF